MKKILSRCWRRLGISGPSKAKCPATKLMETHMETNRTYRQKASVYRHPRWHGTPADASADTKAVLTIPVIFIGPATCENPSMYLFLSEKDQRKQARERKLRSAEQTDFVTPSLRRSAPHVWGLCSLSRAAWGVMLKQASFPNPAQPHRTSSVCTAAQRNTGKGGNSIIASYARVPRFPALPVCSSRCSFHAKGPAAYLSWLNEDGEHSHAQGIHWTRGSQTGDGCPPF